MAPLAPARAGHGRDRGRARGQRNVWNGRSDLSRVGVDGALAWSLLVLVLLFVRFARSSPARRRARGPLVAAGGLYLALVAVDLMHSAQRGYLSNDSVDQQLWTGQAIALVVLAGGVAVAWWRARRRRFRVARLVVELGATPPPNGLRDALAALLDDPTIELAHTPWRTDA